MLLFLLPPWSMSMSSSSSKCGWHTSGREVFGPVVLLRREERDVELLRRLSREREGGRGGDARTMPGRSSLLLLLLLPLPLLLLLLPNLNMMNTVFRVALLSN